MAAAAPPPPPPPPHHDPFSKKYGHGASPPTMRAVDDLEETEMRSVAAQIAAKVPHLNRPAPISHRPTGSAREVQRQRDAAHRRQVADLMASGLAYAAAEKPCLPLLHPPGFGPVPAHAPFPGFAAAGGGGFSSPPSGSSRPARPVEAGPSRPPAPSPPSATQSKVRTVLFLVVA